MTEGPHERRALADSDGLVQDVGCQSGDRTARTPSPIIGWRGQVRELRSGRHGLNGFTSASGVRRSPVETLPGLPQSRDWNGRSPAMLRLSSMMFGTSSKSWSSAPSRMPSPSLSASYGSVPGVLDRVRPLVAVARVPEPGGHRAVRLVVVGEAVGVLVALVVGDQAVGVEVPVGRFGARLVAGPAAVGTRGRRGPCRTRSSDAPRSCGPARPESRRRRSPSAFAQLRKSCGGWYVGDRHRRLAAAVAAGEHATASTACRRSRTAATACGSRCG